MYLSFVLYAHRISNLDCYNENWVSRWDSRGTGFGVTPGLGATVILVGSQTRFMQHGFKMSLSKWQLPSNLENWGHLKQPRTFLRHRYIFSKLKHPLKSFRKKTLKNGNKISMCMYLSFHTCLSIVISISLLTLAYLKYLWD